MLTYITYMVEYKNIFFYIYSFYYEYLVKNLCYIWKLRIGIQLILRNSIIVKYTQRTNMNMKTLKILHCVFYLVLGINCKIIEI